MDSSPAAVLMTATISPPPGMPGTARNDPETRRADYEAAFKYYLSYPDDLIDHVVLLENSGTDLGAFREIAAEAGTSKKLSLVSCSPDYPAGNGKGYGEFLMIDRGLRQADIRPGSMIWKVTGRLRVKNLRSLVLSTPAGVEVYCDLRKVPLIGERLGGNRWAELRVVAFTQDGYQKHFEGGYDKNFVLEKSFFETLYSAWKADRRKIAPRFLVQPELEGISGFSNRSYEDFGYRSKAFIRTLGRRVVPSVWI